MHHDEKIINYLLFYKKIVPEFTKQELDFIATKVVIKSIPRNELYLKQGDIQRKLAFVSEGLLRIYYINSKGNEITVGFSNENVFSTDYSAFVKQMPSNYNIKSVEPSVIIELDFEHIQEGYDLYKNYERFGRLITEKILNQRQKKLESFLFDTAEQRYTDFINDFPHLFNRISITHLASFIGVERQSLTRIRKKLMR